MARKLLAQMKKDISKGHKILVYYFMELETIIEELDNGLVM
jgi:hypothetical protein